ncbi:FGGY-family carbohydrate kinase [Segetibacter koreensis]|uniref:FGGY-family carbohydrate kinase n=1 Tax=Segetibacter koreensis TaxID=398037 RepID=UPI00035F0E55|nr:FGGY family carbohydrate kinase [Segetibacter koreensis]
MSATPVIAIFDVGKTNKKLFLFDENYKIVFERSARFNEMEDEDGFPCENVESLRSSVFDSLHEVFNNAAFEIKAINASGYGASFVNVDESGKAVTPLYNYLKPYPEDLKKQFYDTYGGEKEFSYVTASPVLGHLNSGMQLYWLKYKKPELFKRIKFSLHLPQYLSYLISGKFYSDITSVGCHTNLWNFKLNDYHEWVYKEGIIDKLAPIVPADQVVAAEFNSKSFFAGVGLHDSSAALIPYLVNFHEPFILISTGTWCISLNPFNNQPLTAEELECDCLSYMTFKGKTVKASRLFAGNEHEQQVKRIAEFFNISHAFYKTIEYNPETIAALQKKEDAGFKNKDTKILLKESLFAQRDVSAFSSEEEAYHQLMADIATQQFASTQLVLKGTEVKRIFVDGGFSKNSIYMNLLASLFPEIEVFAASMAQATAVGTALSIHHCWNKKPLPNDIIELKYFSAISPVF